MNVHADFTAEPSTQPLLRGALRGSMKGLFRGLIRPAMPVAGQRVTLRMLTAAMPVTAGVSRSKELIAGRPCEWHRPEQSDGKVMLYLHGGAFLIGSPATHRGLCASIARRSQLSVCVLDYRLAPEHPFPAARDDAVEAYKELLARGYLPQNIALGGDSAGGNLGLITALRLAELALPVPGALVCFSPVVDFSGDQLHNPAAGDPLLNVSWIEQAADLYCPPGMNRRDPALSPIFADLAGLPPLLIQVGEEEVLLNDSLRLAERARAAGVTVRLERYPGLWHVFQAHTGLLRSADEALDRVAVFLSSLQG
ncbi:MAG TPA: alpha/beta hydrolase [Pseudomonas xinjiangensis]|uniref:Alpha/beta hydrolase n=2 Tax=root TaxID=1 RepID=A0A7V1BPA9_9GAMM|nr:alpha/beta hydrolase [Halopseudomonas xinjiangensis]HEC47341.1 alpha/beta hydrolase [Halopseudomonas xinjiangensis]